MVTISTQSVDVLSDGFAAVLEKMRKFALAENEAGTTEPEVLLGYALALHHFADTASHLINGLDEGRIPGVTVTNFVADDGLPTGMYL
jgi:hypothetical protein